MRPLGNLWRLAFRIVRLRRNYFSTLEQWKKTSVSFFIEPHQKFLKIFLRWQNTSKRLAASSFVLCQVRRIGWYLGWKNAPYISVTPGLFSLYDSVMDQHLLSSLSDSQTNISQRIHWWKKQELNLHVCQVAEIRLCSTAALHWEQILPKSASSSRPPIW